MAKKKTERLSMLKLREVLRLGLKCGLKKRDIGRSCSISHVTAGKYVKLAKKAGLTYEQVEQLDDTELNTILESKFEKVMRIIPLPDYADIHKELKRKGMTLELLWHEYKLDHPAGYQSTQFSEHYRRWKRHLNVSMRQSYKAGEKLFVDYAGQTVIITDRDGGQDRKAQIFVAVLGASNYTYAEASWSQDLPDWISSHIRTFEYFGGVAKITIPDNLRSGVSKACRYEPDINPTYHDMASHYGTVVIPARVRKPQDKAKVEAGVQLVERWILAALRKRIFFTLSELNLAISELLEKLNNKKFKKLEGTRRSWFESIDKPALLPLAVRRYEFAEWKKAKVNIDYHIELHKHYYSVPYKLTGEPVVIRSTYTTVEILYKGQRVTSHIRNDTEGYYSTRKAHMPEHHRKYLDCNGQKLLSRAKSIGESTLLLIEAVLKSRKYPVQGYRSCLGILHLAKKYTKKRLEAACGRGLLINAYSYKSLKSILKNSLDTQPLPEPQSDLSISHENIRGQYYFNYS